MKNTFWHRTNPNKFRAGTAANASGAHEVTPGFSGVRVVQSLVFCVVFCRSLFVFFSMFWPSKYRNIRAEGTDKQKERTKLCLFEFHLFKAVDPFCHCTNSNKCGTGTAVRVAQSLV